MNHSALQWFNRPRWLATVTMVCFLFFLNKPFHIDDAAFLNTADRLPFSLIGDVSGPVEYVGSIFPDLNPYESTHPPFIAYVLKLVDVLHPKQGFHFWIYHLFFLIFPAIALSSGLFLGKALARENQWLWFLVFCPAFFVNGTNLMADLAMTAFWMAAMAFAVRSQRVADWQNWAGLISAVFFALMTAYQSLALVPLLGAFFCLRRQFKMLVPLCIAAALFTLYLFIIYLMTGTFPYFSHGIDYNITYHLEMGAKATNLLHKTFALPIHLGFSLLAATPLLVAGQSGKDRCYNLVCSLLGSVLLVETMDTKGMLNPYGPLEMVVLRLLCLVGLFWFISLVRIGFASLKLLRPFKWALNLETSLQITMVLWFFGTLFYNLTMMPFISGRYLLPAIPAALWLALNSGITPTLRLRSLVGAVGICLLLAWVDFGQARADFRLYKEVQGKVPRMEDLWFSDDFGLYRYLKKKGAHYLPKDRDQLPVGDYVLLSRNQISGALLPKLQQIGVWEMPGALGLSLYQPQAKAGFYCSHDGLLPLAITPTVKKAILFKVIRE